MTSNKSLTADSRITTSFTHLKQFKICTAHLNFLSCSLRLGDRVIDCKYISEINIIFSRVACFKRVTGADPAARPPRSDCN